MDVACLQEVEQSSLSIITRNTHLSESVSVFNGLSGDGSAIVFNPRKFQKQEERFVRLSSLIDTYLPTLSSASSPLDRALYRELSEKTSSVVSARLEFNQSSFILASSHLFWDPKYPDLKLLQAYLLSRHLNDLSSSTPMILGVDLNSTPSNAAYQMIQRGEVDCLHAEHPVSFRKPGFWKGISIIPSLCSGSFESAYKHVNGLEPGATNWTVDFKECIDFIFTRNISARSVGGLPSLNHVASLPNKDWPSDHLPLVAEFVVQ